MGFFGGIGGGFGPAGVAGAMGAAAAAAAANGGHVGSGTQGLFGFAGNAGNPTSFSGGRPPGGYFGSPGNAGLASAFSGQGQAIGSQGQFSSGPAGRGVTGNALANSFLNDDFTTPYSLADSVSVFSPTLGKLAGLLGLDSVMSTSNFGHTPASNSGYGASIPGLQSSKSVTQNKPKPSQPAPKRYRRPEAMGAPFGYDYLRGADQMTPIQRLSATAAFNGPLDYFKSQLGQEFITANGEINKNMEILPSWYDYLRRMGLNVNHGDINSIADALYA